jgi:hypothetical protein
MRVACPCPDRLHLEKDKPLRCSLLNSPSPCLVGLAMVKKVAKAQDTSQSACKFCKRPRGTANPITKGKMAKSEHILFITDRAVCNQCRSYFNVTSASTSYRTNVALAQVNSATHTEFMVGLAKYIDQINESDSGYISRTAIDGPVVSLKAKEVTSFKAIVLVGFWWSAEMYKSRKGNDIPKGRDYIYKKRVGILMDEKEGKLGRVETYRGFVSLCLRFQYVLRACCLRFQYALCTNLWTGHVLRAFPYLCW